MPAANDTTLPRRRPSPICEHCFRGTLKLVDEKPDPLFGVLGIVWQTLKCTNVDCAIEQRC